MRVPSSERVVLGLDVGTTSVKVGAFAPDGRTAGAGEVAYELSEPRPGEAVQDPEELLRAVMAATREAVAEAGRAGAEIAGLAVSSAMHSIAALDDRDRPLTPLLTWADIRGAEEAEALRRSHADLHGRTGTPLHPFSPLVKLVWFRAHDRATCRAARRWVGIKELVLHRLTGRWVVDHSVASGTGLLNLQALDWDPEALDVAGIRREQLAELVATDAQLPLGGAAATELGLPEGTPVVAGAGDGPLANLGVGAVHPGMAACSIGTSGALRLVVERPVVDPAGRVFCYQLTRDRWVVGGAINNGGVVLEWVGEALAPDLGPHAAEALMDLAAQAPPGSDGLVMLPYLLSERAPHWSSLPSGAYIGLHRAHRRPHLVRAAIEGVCQQLALVLASMRDAGQEVRELRATGGFARSGLWRQMLTDALGLPVGFPAGHEGSGFGAALLGMQALGLVESIDVAADLVQIADVVDPDPAAARVYAELLPTFSALYDALGPAFRALRRLGDERS